MKMQRMEPREKRGRRRRHPWIAGTALALALGSAVAAGWAQPDDLDSDPIRYTQTAATDPVAQLQARLERGEVTLARDRQRGYLPAVLKALNVPVASQTLVFSKTSFQRDRISPLTPRALYFNDQVYVGWVQGGPVLEISATDPQLGGTFYVLDQESMDQPRFVRQNYECLSCHHSSLTKGVPGHTVRSVFSGRDGLPVLSAGTFITGDRSPLEERWGGWYVTGTHGRQRHMGNLTVKDAADAAQLERDRGANMKVLKGFFDPSPYLTPHSDIVALMVLEHQTSVQNLITRASYETRKALHYEQLLNRELKRAPDYRSDSTTSRIKSVAEPLLRGLLFSGAAPLTDRLQGTSPFAAEFPRPGPRDRAGRSLRDLDLKTRLFRYPCSYLVYGDAFAALPAPVKELVLTRLREVLTGQDTSSDFAHLSETDRKSILAILEETLPGFSTATGE